VDGLNGMDGGAGMYMGTSGNGLGGMSVIQGTQSSGAPDVRVSNRYMSYHVKY
jgi:hypothetical protein